MQRGASAEQPLRQSSSRPYSPGTGQSPYRVQFTKSLVLARHWGIPSAETPLCGARVVCIVEPGDASGLPDRRLCNQSGETGPVRGRPRKCTPSRLRASLRCDIEKSKDLNPQADHPRVRYFNPVPPPGLVGPRVSPISASGRAPLSHIGPRAVRPPASASGPRHRLLMASFLNARGTVNRWDSRASTAEE